METDTQETADPQRNPDYLQKLSRAATKAKAAIRAKAPENFACFCRTVLKDETTQRAITLAPHHIEWFEHHDRCRAAGKFTGILAPPDSGKSQIWAVGYPLFTLGQDPTSRAAICTASKESAKKRVTPAKDYVQHDPDFRTVFPDCVPERLDKWTQQEFTIRRPPGIKDPSFIGCGIERPPMGARITMLGNDDICTYDNTISEPAMRQKVIDLWSNGFDTRLGPESHAFHIGGIIHNRDLNNVLMDDDRFWFIMQRVSDDCTHLIQEDLRTGKTKRLPLWPRAWNPEFLLTKKRNNPRAFRRAYQHIGYSDSERTFKESAIRESIKMGGEQPRSGPCVIGVDISGKKRAGNAIVVVQLTGERRRVASVEVGDWSSPELARRISAAHQTYKPRMVVVENNAYQDALIDWMKSAGFGHIDITPFTTGKQKADEEMGLPGLAAEFERGIWELPFEEGHVIGMGCPCSRCQLVEELVDHPFGKSTDLVMATWFARYACQQTNMASEIEFTQGKPLPRRGDRRDHRGRRMNQGRLASFRRGRRTT